MAISISGISSCELMITIFRRKILLFYKKFYYTLKFWKEVLFVTKLFKIFLERWRICYFQSHYAIRSLIKSLAELKMVSLSSASLAAERMGSWSISSFEAGFVNKLFVTQYQNRSSSELNDCFSIFAGVFSILSVVICEEWNNKTITL